MVKWIISSFAMILNLCNLKLNFFSRFESFKDVSSVLRVEKLFHSMERKILYSCKGFIVKDN